MSASLYSLFVLCNTSNIGVASTKSSGGAERPRERGNERRAYCGAGGGVSPDGYYAVKRFDAGYVGALKWRYLLSKEA